MGSWNWIRGLFICNFSQFSLGERKKKQSHLRGQGHSVASKLRVYLCIDGGKKKKTRVWQRLDQYEGATRSSGRVYRSTSVRSSRVHKQMCGRKTRQRLELKDIIGNDRCNVARTLTLVSLVSEMLRTRVPRFNSLPIRVSLLYTNV